MGAGKRWFEEGERGKSEGGEKVVAIVSLIPLSLSTFPLIAPLLRLLLSKNLMVVAD
jgi:hypothetical protein